MRRAEKSKERWANREGKDERCMRKEKKKRRKNRGREGEEK